jgi:predicted regulator of Ras-like GTPase activity (Roadblock/LC7/MglB family)
MAMQGSLKDMSVADIIQHQCQDRKTAMLTVERKGVSARIFFKDGSVVHAASGSLIGEEVVYETLVWEDGAFTLELGSPSPEISIKRNWSSLLLEGAKRMDEFSVEETESFEDSGKTRERKEEIISRTLNELVSAQKGYFAAAVVGIDGNVIASCLNDVLDEAIIAAISTASLNFGKRGLNLVSSGPFRGLVLQGEKGYIYLHVVDPYTLLVAVASADLNIQVGLAMLKSAAANMLPAM